MVIEIDVFFFAALCFAMFGTFATVMLDSLKFKQIATYASEGFGFLVCISLVLSLANWVTS